MMTANSELRSEVLKYVAGAEVPKSQFINPEISNKSFNFEHFTIPIGYSKIFTDKVKFNIQHLVGNEKIDGINPKLMKDIMASRHHLDNDNIRILLPLWLALIYQQLMQKFQLT